MTKVLTLAWNAWLEVLFRKVMILFVLFVLVMGATLYGLHREVITRATEEEAATAAFAMTMMIEQGMSVWVNVLVILGAFLGSSSIAMEFRTRTALGVLARPVHHWQFMLGKWLGLTAFLIMLLAIAAGCLALLVAYYNTSIHPAFGEAYTPFVWMRLAEFVARLIVASGLGIALGCILSPVVAGALTLIVCFADPTLFISGFDAEPRWLAVLNHLLYYAFPGRLPDEFFGQRVMQHYADAPLGFFASVIAENLIYTVVVFVLCAILFTRREGAARE